MTLDWLRTGFLTADGDLRECFHYLQSTNQMGTVHLCVNEFDGFAHPLKVGDVNDDRGGASVLRDKDRTMRPPCTGEAVRDCAAEFGKRHHILCEVDGSDRQFSRAHVSPLLVDERIVQYSVCNGQWHSPKRFCAIIFLSCESRGDPKSALTTSKRDKERVTTRTGGNKCTTRQNSRHV